MNPKEKIHESWRPIMGLLYHGSLRELNEEILPNTSCQPAKENIFNVFKMPVKEIKVVILGQDPYPTPGDAIGYSFATDPSRRVPRSLKIIQEELETNFAGTFRFEKEDWKTLSHWRSQGVFLLNTALTVETGKPGSHTKYWEHFTSKVIQFIAKENPCVWMLWGKKAFEYSRFMRGVNPPFLVSATYTRENVECMPNIPETNYILKSPHPAAELYSKGKGGFFGCDHFYLAYHILKKTKNFKINW